MSFRMIHENYTVSDLDRSIKFYGDALDLHEVSRNTTDDFIIVYLSNDSQAILNLNLLGLKNIRSRTIWVNVNSIWHLRRMILIRHIKGTKKWVVSALKTLKWVSISSRTRTAIGSKFCRDIDLYYKQKELGNTISQLFYVYASSSFNFETVFSFSPLPVVFNLMLESSFPDKIKKNK